MSKIRLRLHSVEKDIINKSGSWFSYGEERIGQGRENAKKYLLEHAEMMNEIYLKVRKAYGIADADEEAQLELKLGDKQDKPDAKEKTAKDKK